jgi:LysR family glycine cleavage system transcriptional activator
MSGSWTDEGERFAQRVRGALAELAAAMQEVSARSNPRRLRVSVTPSFAARWLLPRMGHFVATHPDIDLDVRASEINVDFQHDDSDCAVRYGLGNWPGVVSEPLLEERYLTVCSPRLVHRRLLRQPADLARCTLLRSNDEYWRPWFAAAGLSWPEPERGPIFNDSSHMLQAAIDGHGIALARTSLLGLDVRNGLLVKLFDVEVPSERRYYFVHPARAAASAKLAAFRLWLRAEAARTDEFVSPATTRKPRGPKRRR